MVLQLVGLAWTIGLAAAFVMARAAALADSMLASVPVAITPRRAPTAEERFGRGSAGYDGLPSVPDNALIELTLK